MVNCELVKSEIISVLDLVSHKIIRIVKDIDSDTLGIILDTGETFMMFYVPTGNEIALRDALFNNDIDNILDKNITDVEEVTCRMLSTIKKTITITVEDGHKLDIVWYISFDDLVLENENIFISFLSKECMIK